MVIAGIDYSLTSPGMTIHTGIEWNFSACQFFAISDRKKSITFQKGFLWVQQMEEYLSQDERMDNLASTFTGWCQQHRVEQVFIEDYAFAARGRIFHIGENTGILKNKLYHLGIPYSVVAPPTVKKFATGRGNAQKDGMSQAFLEETKLDLHKLLNTENIINTSPTSDIIDSYYICKYGHQLRSKP
jgi:Holliday junction resolvasome RuvABC endonuclease subunit